MARLRHRAREVALQLIYMLDMRPETPPQEAQVKDFFDLVSPGAVKFNVDHYILGDSYRCAWAVREYPPTTSPSRSLNGTRCWPTLRSSSAACAATA